ncbi:hypothetical protein MA03_02755 [Infirmifilum uzonense]|uniref:Transcriptional regulator HTH-type FeoC domain-containing protein n=1 Tax=Infirmifilum uzonense TaxID=1550241 RepID=A0A0F7FGQ2_9CREN|nr:hypothetical protein [Infirmifilum uzonense]AKG38405.1 hypothetical protein MA03_02755 [Infirmifilum uzonense]
MESTRLGENLRRVLEALSREGVADPALLSRATGIPRERVELILLMLRDMRVLEVREGKPACSQACEKCPLARLCQGKNLRLYTLKP